MKTWVKVVLVLLAVLLVAGIVKFIIDLQPYNRASSVVDDSEQSLNALVNSVQNSEQPDDSEYSINSREFELNLLENNAINIAINEFCGLNIPGATVEELFSKIKEINQDDNLPREVVILYNGESTAYSDFAFNYTLGKIQADNNYSVFPFDYSDDGYYETIIIQDAK